MERIQHDACSAQANVATLEHVWSWEECVHNFTDDRVMGIHSMPPAQEYVGTLQYVWNETKRGAVAISQLNVKDYKLVGRYKRW